MRMVDVDDVGPPPRRRDVPGGDLLGAERGEGEDMGNRRALPRGAPALAASLHRDDFHLVPEHRRSLGEALDHPFHAARLRPVILREVQDSHLGCCQLHHDR
jgi:hypothetical protein